MLVLVGNSPSSGSTLLSELLDSTPLSMSGEELGLFSSKVFYKNFKDSGKNTSLSKSIYTSRNGLFHKGLCSYGVSSEDIESLLEKSDSMMSFLDAFIKQYSAFRQRDVEILFEKTPQNLTCIGEFLESFDSSYFIHIVRNPLHVYQSLLKRGFPPFIALITWLVDVAAFYKYKDHDRVVSIRYEDLLENPYEQVRNILLKVTGVDVDVSEIEKRFQKNAYREKFTLKIDSWTNSKAGEVNHLNSSKTLDKQTVLSFSAAQNMSISKKYAEKFEISECSYLELIEYFDYGEIIELEGFNQPQKKWEDYKQLLAKYFYDLKFGDAKVTDIDIYLNPIRLKKE